jgi:hypothetical protein
MTKVRFLSVIFVAACGGESHGDVVDDAGGDADSDADSDADADSDSDADADSDSDADADSEPPVQGEPGEDQPGDWVVDPESEAVVLEGAPPAPSCCHCPANPLSMTSSGTEIALAAADLDADDFQMILVSADGDVLDGPLAVPGRLTDIDFADQMLVSTADGYEAVFVAESNGESEAYLRAIGQDLALGTEFQLTFRQTPVQLAVGSYQNGGIGVAFAGDSNLFALRAETASGTAEGSIRQLTTFGTASGARAAGAGDRLGVAFSDNREGQYDVFFSLVDANGEPTTPEGSKVAPTELDSTNPFVVWTGTEFAIVWEERWDTRLRGGPESASVWFARADDTGAPIEGSVRVTLPYEGESGVGVEADGFHIPRALLWTGAELLLVAMRSDGHASPMHRQEIAVFRLDSSGRADPDGPVVLSSAESDDHRAVGTDLSRAVAAVLDPANVAVAWNVHDQAGLPNCEGDESFIRFARLALHDW